MTHNFIFFVWIRRKSLFKLMECLVKEALMDQVIDQPMAQLVLDTQPDDAVTGLVRETIQKIPECTLDKGMRQTKLAYVPSVDKSKEVKTPESSMHNSLSRTLSQHDLAEYNKISQERTSNLELDQEMKHSNMSRKRKHEKMDMSQSCTENQSLPVDQEKEQTLIKPVKRQKKEVLEKSSMSSQPSTSSTQEVINWCNQTTTLHNCEYSFNQLKGFYYDRRFVFSQPLMQRIGTLYETYENLF